ncbi:MAG: DUF503 domain-containing protein [Desulfohalobiaceae bacterium]|nr:DUF503 domain-containing protein [Desulfohalobiaceae bacterium]
MIIGTLKIEFRLHGICSIKEKRGIANSLKQKLRNKFNVALSEIDGQDSLQTLQLALVTVSTESRRVQTTLNKALAMIEAISPEEIVDVQTEVFGA